MDERELSDDEKGMIEVPAMDGSEAFHQVVKEMLLNGHQARAWNPMLGAKQQRENIIDRTEPSRSLIVFDQNEARIFETGPGRLEGGKVVCLESSSVRGKNSPIMMSVLEPGLTACGAA